MSARVRPGLGVASAALVACFGWSTPAAADFSPTFDLDDPNATTQDQFGHSVALEAGLAAVGAPGDGTLGPSVGQVHLFDAASGALLRTIDDPTVTTADAFGWSVALDAGRLLVGAPGDDTLGLFNPGQAQLFDASDGSLLQTFDDPAVTFIDVFGTAVDLDGDDVLIGEPGDNGFGVNVGRARLFSASTGALVRTFDDPTVTGGDLFGSAVAVDAGRVLIGAPSHNISGSVIGQAHLFDAATGALLHTFDDPTVTTADQFGTSVALQGDRVLIGAPGDDTNGTDVGQAHLFAAGTGALLDTFDDPTVTTEDDFGHAVALDGRRAVVSAQLDDTEGANLGQVHVFDIITGALLQTLDEPTITTADQFGQSVALYGRHLIVGASTDDTAGLNVGQAHLFEEPATPVPLLPAALLVVLAALLAGSAVRYASTSFIE